jgi:hypothetical protein
LGMMCHHEGVENDGLLPPSASQMADPHWPQGCAEAFEQGVRYVISRSHGWFMNWSRCVITECT